MKKLSPALALTACLAFLAACSAPRPEPAPVRTAPARMEKAQTAVEWKVAHCIGAASECAAKPAGIPQKHDALTKARVIATAYIPGADPEARGFGTVATGGTTPCVVSTTAGTGIGSFSSCARQSNVYITFTSAGPFLVDKQQTYLGNNVTIDGCSGGQNGITLNQQNDVYRALVLEGPGSNIVIRCVTFQGQKKTGPESNEHDLLALDGTSGAITKVFIDRCTFNQGTDGGLDITGDVSDVTVQRSFLYDTPMAQLIKYDYQGRFPRNLSIHHNVYTQNGERNPQIRGGVFADLVNNVVGPSKEIIDAGNGQPYSQYGSFLWASNTSGEGIGNPKVNVVTSAYFGPFDSGPSACSGGNGITVCKDSGASTATTYLSGNSCSPGACPASPAGSPNAIPAASAIPVTPISGLRALLPSVGSPVRSASAQAAIDAVGVLLGGATPPPTPTPSPTVSPIPTPSPTTSPTPSPFPTCPPPSPCAGDIPAALVSSTCTAPRTTTTRLTNGNLQITVDRGVCTSVVK